MSIISGNRKTESGKRKRVLIGVVARRPPEGWPTKQSAENLLDDLIVKIFPVWIHRIYQIYLLLPGTTLNLFLSYDRRFYVSSVFVIHKLVDFISPCKTTAESVFMLIHSFHQVSGNSRIERSVLFGCQYVDVVLVGLHKVLLSRRLLRRSPTATSSQRHVCY